LVKRRRSHIRIVDVCAFYTPYGGGVRTYVHRKLAAAAAAGHELVVLAPGATNGWRELPGGGILATLASPKLPLDRRYRYFGDEEALHRALDEWRPDFVEASSPWASAAMVARWRGTAGRALVMHADPLSAYAYRWFGRIASTASIDRGFDWFWRHLRELDRAMDTVVCASRDLAGRLAAGGLTRVATIPMGVEPGVFSPAHRDLGLRAELLARCELPADATLLLGVGRYSAEKRWGMVIEAATAAGVISPTGLILVGEGRSHRRLMAHAAGSPHVVIGEAVRDRRQLATIMASADALVHACEAETFCMVAAEAAASGLPIIAPDRGGAADHAAQNGGRLYRAADVGALRDALAEFASSARTQAASMPVSVRTMDEHFGDLFALYGGFSRPALLAA
jgi:alpha-1,6-mannosyltransferase